MLAKIVTIGRNSLKRHNFSVMAEKALLRFKEKDYQKQSESVRTWCAAHAMSCDDFMRSLDLKLYEETQAAAAEIERHCRLKLSTIELDLGGGGNYPLLYFLVRYLQPENVIETGVAAGWSSQAMLTALAKNDGDGKLYSSDFPYFRYEEPEKLVGFVVDESFKSRWRLFIEGDKFNLPAIMKETGAVDLFHYDSDKSYSGRRFAYETVRKKLSDRAVVIFDDIQDNFHFRDFVTAQDVPFCVFEFEGKYIGLTGSIVKDA
ncbi:MAG: class I SAM-dependent methyltransferase [Rhodospirillales bacterium]|nr:class I SAM-dependent methyltransferase [Rhodospirillales bacterium]MCB9995190.1 class I SAM-dependent methyltransferase [Rhodospirillales bacterium]